MKSERVYNQTVRAQKALETESRHGGMGITQRALAAGVPVCLAP